MKIFLRILFTLLLLTALGGVAYFGLQYREASSEKETLIRQNGELQSAIDAIGPTVTTWTVKAKVLHGIEIKAEDLVEQTTPQSSVTDVTVLDINSIVGKYYKVDIYPGTSLTTDLVSEDDLSGTTYERDMTFEYLPIGIRVGDYVDIRINLPYGEEMIVVRHHRVMQLILEANTIKVYLDEAELALWSSAMKDKALYSLKGLTLYVTKYVEPGVDTPAIQFYPVRKDMESFVTLNPNITDKTVCINSELRKEIDKKLKAVIDEDAGLLAAGTSKESSETNTARDSYISKIADGSITEPTNSNNNKDNSNPITNVNNNASDSLDSIGDTIDITNSTDAAGNSSSVTVRDENKANGNDVYVDENIIQ